MKVMSYNEYEARFEKAFRKYSGSMPKTEQDSFIKTLKTGNHIKAQYLDDVNSSELLGSDHVDPETFASWVVELHEDEFNTPAEVNENDSVFKGSMNFTKIR